MRRTGGTDGASEQRERFFNDVFFDPAKRVIDLRVAPKVRAVNDALFPPGTFQHRHRRTILVGLFVLAFGSSMLMMRTGSAATTQFYPAACTGGWNNPTQATGAPTLTDRDPASMYNADNSAQYVKGQDMTCDTFTGTVPPSGTPTSLSLVVHWSVDDGSIDHTPPPVADPTVTASDAIASSGTGASTNAGSDTSATTDNSTASSPAPDADASAPSSDAAPSSPTLDQTATPATPSTTPAPADPEVIQVPSGGSIPDDPSTPDNAPAPAPVPDATPAPAPAATSDSSAGPQASLGTHIADLISDGLARFGTAQAIAADDPIASDSPSDSTATPPADATGASDPVASIGTTPSLDTSGAFLDVRYTMDGGATWQTLGSVDAVSWQDATYTIPSSAIASWAEISNLKVGFFSRDSQSTPAAYVDAVELDADYSDASTQVTVVPTVEVTDPSLAIVTGTQSDYSLSETPTFTVVDPDLSTDDLSTLVKDNKATVLKDDLGVFDDSVATSADATVASDSQSSSDAAPASDSALSAAALLGTSFSGSGGSLLRQLPSFFGTLADRSGGIDVAADFFASGKHSVDNFLSFVVPSYKYMLAFVGETPPPVIDAEVLDSVGEGTAIQASVERVVVDGQEKDEVVVAKPARMFRPGRYTLQVTLHTPDALIVSKQDFTWGVLAVNMDRSVYATGETPYIQMGVIDDNGHTICDADMQLDITAPDGTVSTLTTADGTVVRDPECGPDNVISVPDYYAHFKGAGETGTYAVSLSATTADGTRTVHDAFAVKDSVSFDVRRTGPTRIYPVASYPETLYITPSEDWTGTVTETLPSNFQVTQPDHSQAYDSDTPSADGDSQVLSWHVSLKSGVETAIGYYFTGPRISPEFYLLGPASFYADGDDPSTATPVFQETRQWQIADDAVCTTIAAGVTNGSWGTAANWTNCTGTGGLPGAADDVTIASNASIILNIATMPVVNSLTINGSLNTLSGSTSEPVTTKTLTIGSGGTLTANASTITLSGTTGTPFTVTGTFAKGTSTVNYTGDNTSGNTTIAPTAYYNLTLSSATETYVLASNAMTVDPAGTFAVGNSTTFDTTTAGCTGSTSCNFSAGHLTEGNSSTILFRASTVTLNGTSGNVFTRSGVSTFTPGTSTIVITSDAAISFSIPAANNLTLAPTLTTARAYSCLSNVVLTGNMTINPSSSSANALTVTMSGPLTVPATGTLLIEGSGSATSVLDTSTSNLAVSTGLLSVSSAGTLNANGSTITLNGTSDTPLVLNGTFNKGTSTVSFTGAHATTNIQIPGISYYNLTVNKSGETFALASNSLVVDPAGTLTITNGTFDTTATGCAGSTSCNFSAGHILISSASTAILNTRAATITLTGTSGTLVAHSTLGVVTAGTATFVATGDGTPTFSSGSSQTFYNVTLSPAITANRTYTLGTGLVVSSSLTIDPSSSGSNVLTVLLSSAVTNATTSTTLVEGSGSATSVLDTSSASSFAYGTGTLDIESTGTLNANASTVTLSGNVANPFIFNGGTFNPGTSTVTFTGASGNTVIPGLTYYSLNISDTGATYVLGGNITLNQAGTLGILNGTLDTNDHAATPHDWNITAGKISFSNATTSILTANTSTITLSGTSGILINKQVFGVFNAGTSTIIATPDASVQLFSGTFTAYNVILSPTITSNRTYTINSTNVTTTFNGNFDIIPNSASANTLTVSASGGAVIVAATGTLFVRHNLSGSANSVFDTSASNYAITAGVLSISAADSFNANGSSITVDGTSDTPLVVNGTFNAGTSTVTFTGTHAMTNVQIPGQTYHSLTFNKTGETFMLAGAITLDAAGTLTLTAGTFDTSSANSYAVTAGKIAVASSASNTFNANGSTIMLDATSGTLFSRGALSVFNQGASSFVVTSASGTPTLLASPTTFNQLTINSTATVINAGFAITMSSANPSNKLWIEQGMLTDGAAQIVGTANGTLEIDNGAGLCIGVAGETNATCNNATVGGTTQFPTNYTAANITLSPTSNVYYNGDAGQTVSSVPTYGNLLFMGTITGNRGYSFSTGTVTIKGNLTIDPSAASALTATLTLGGTTTVASTGTTLIEGGGTGSATGVLDTKSGSSFAFSTGALDLEAHGTINVRNSTFTLTGTSGTLITDNSGTFTTGGTSTTVMSGTGTEVLSTVPIAFDNLTSSGTVTLGANITTGASDTFLVSAGTFAPSTYSVTGSTASTLSVSPGATLDVQASTYAGNYSGYVTTTLSSGSTVDYNAAGSQTVDATQSYANLNISTSGTKTLSGATTATGTLLVQGGTLDTASGSNYALTVNSLTIGSSGTLAAEGSTITLGGKWINGGTFNQGTSTVVLSGSTTVSIAGSTVFYNLTLTNATSKEVDFSVTGSPVYAVKGLFTATGHSGAPIKIRSSLAGTKWTFAPNGTSSVSYVDVADSGCQPGSIYLLPANMTNSGNNDYCWSGPTITFSISSPVIGFGALSAIAPRYATSDNLGSSSDVEGNNITVSAASAGGYVLSVQGGSLSSNGHTITPIGNSNVASNIGFEQFGLRAIATGGSGAVAAPYSGSGYAFGASSTTPSTIATETVGDGVPTTYSLHYLANIAPLTPPGKYTTTLTFIVTGSF